MFYPVDNVTDLQRLPSQVKVECSFLRCSNDARFHRFVHAGGAWFDQFLCDDHAEESEVG